MECSPPKVTTNLPSRRYAAVRARVAVEAAHVDWWRKYVGLDGRVVGMSTFGESAPGNVLYDYFKITVAAVLAATREVLK